MDDHIQRVEELFSAAKTEFKHLEFYLLPQLRLRLRVEEQPPPLCREVPDTWDIIRKYNQDYKLIFVGDATMSPYEILQPGGSVEYNNEEPGAVWIAAPDRRLPAARLDQPRAARRVAVPPEHRASSTSSMGNACTR